MHVTILAWQARILLLASLGSLSLALYLGVDPLTATWRACLMGWIASAASGWLLRTASDAIALGLAETDPVPAVATGAQGAASAAGTAKVPTSVKPGLRR